MAGRRRWFKGKREAERYLKKNDLREDIHKVVFKNRKGKRETITVGGIERSGGYFVGDAFPGWLADKIASGRAEATPV